MKIAISSGRQAHYRLPANSFARRGFPTTLYTTTPRSRLRDFSPAVHHTWVPGPVALFSAVTHTRTPLPLDEMDSALFDRLASLRLQECDLFLGASTSSLATGRLAKRRGAAFVLDRACPDIRVQQALLAEEARKVGASFRGNSAQFIAKQVEEYEESDLILCPSDYSRHSFPPHLRKKTIVAPLCGRSKPRIRAAKTPGSPFVLGVVGGEPLRKGYLYLLRAWKDLSLPNAHLLIRTGDEIHSYPVLNQILRDDPSVKIVSYLPDINSFYSACDAFVLPSIDDGFGMSLFEAMASGLPSIATRNCGAVELLEPEKDFLLIDAFSASQLKQEIQRLYEDEDLRSRLSLSGQTAVSSLEKDCLTLPYERGIDDLLEAVKAKRIEG